MTVTSSSSLRSKWRCVPAVVAVILIVLLYFKLVDLRYLKETYEGHVDQFINVQELAEIARSGVPSASLLPSVLVAVPYWYSTPESEIPYDKFTVDPPYVNAFKFHTSFIHLLLAPFAMLFGAGMTLAGASVGAVFMMVGVSMWHLRGAAVPWYLAILFSLLLVIHPHSLSILLNDYYVVRLVVPFFLATLFLIDRKPRAIVPISVFACLAALCREEPGAYVAAAIAVYVTLTRSWDRRWAFLVAALLLWSAGGFYVTYSDPTIPLSTKDAFLRLLRAEGMLRNLLQQDRLVFLAVNVLGFGLLPLFAPRQCLVALFLMVPNMVTTIGGAEATGFATHYHSFYAAAVIWAAAAGLVNVVRVSRTRAFRAVPVVLIFLPLLVTGLWTDSLARRGWLLDPRRIQGLLAFNDPLSRETVHRYVADVRREFGPEERVVVGFPIMPLADFGRNVFLAPANLSKADSVVLQSTESGLIMDGNIFPFEWEKVNKTVAQRMTDSGFDLSNPGQLDRFVVFRKGFEDGRAK